MSTASVLIAADQPSGPTTSSSAPRYTLLLSTDPALIEAAQRLRHDVFTSEPGFDARRRPSTAATPTASTSSATTCWSARTTPASSSAATGCCRRRAPSPREGSTPQPNSTSRALDALRPSLVEMGRAVVREDHRNGGVVLLMWAGILAYLDRCGYDYVTGCVSVPVAGHSGRDAGQPDPRRPRLRPTQARRPSRLHGAPVPARDRRRKGTRRHRSACAGVGSAADARLSAARRPGVRRARPRSGLRCRRLPGAARQAQGRRPLPEAAAVGVARRATWPTGWPMSSHGRRSPWLPRASCDAACVARRASRQRARPVVVAVRIAVRVTLRADAAARRCRCWRSRCRAARTSSASTAG